MRLNTQQKITAAMMALLFLIAAGTTIFFDAEPDMVLAKEFNLSTSIPTQETSPTGWWNLIPTDPSLPALPGSNKSTLTPIPVSTP